MSKSIASLAILLILSVAGIDVRAEFSDDLRAAIESHRRPLVVSETALTGDGAEWLLERARRARFTLLGESHLNAETPAFTGALLRELRSHGYSAYAVECGPQTTRLLIEELQSGGLDAAETFLTRYPFSIAFLDHREETRTAADALSLGYEVWGFDQEFIGSPRNLLLRLMTIAPSSDARELARAALDRAVAGFDHFIATGDQSRGFILTATREDYDELVVAFEDVEEAQEILDQMRASAAVYRAYGERRYYDNNATRIELMKRNLLRHFEQAGFSPIDTPKILFKAGTYHMGKGHTPMHVLDVGNFAHELAIAAGSESFHVNVLAAGQVGPDGRFEPWVEKAPHLALIFDQATDEGPMVIDLTPLRSMLTQRGDKDESLEELQRLVLAFDAVVLYPRFTPASGLYPMPGS